MVPQVFFCSVCFGLKQSAGDHTYLYKYEGGVYFGIIIYVDDILIACNDDRTVTQFKKHLGAHFTFKDLRKPQFFLGIEIHRSKDGISLCQHKYVLDMLQDTGLSRCKPQSTPMDSSSHLNSCDKDHLSDAKQYIRLIGRLQYLCITRPDINFAVNKLSQFLANSCKHHLTATYRVLKYLKGTIGL